MDLFHHTVRLHGLLIYGAYGWLFVSGILHFAVDVVSQYLRGKRVPGPATTLYYGLNSTYAVSQVLFAALALFAIQHDGGAMGQGYGLALGFLAACAWFVLCLRFIEYPQPRVAVAVFAGLLAGVALTSFSLQ
jgi:hypothetical protein